MFTFQDATGEDTDDGRLFAYVDGSPSPASYFLDEDVYMPGGGGADLGYLSVFTANPAEANRSFIGDIAVVRIYDRVLSRAKILGNFNATGPGLGFAYMFLPPLPGCHRRLYPRPPRRHRGLGGR